MWRTYKIKGGKSKYMISSNIGDYDALFVLFKLELN
jgi:hypothetical protein